MRALVADDDDDVRLLLTMWLRGAGYDVVTVAEDGAEAVEGAGRSRPDLVVLDLAMPRMDGLEAATRIRKVLPDARIVIQSGFSAGRMGQKAVDAGADAYVEKSAGPEPLLSAVEDLLHVRTESSLPPTSVPTGSEQGGTALSRQELLLDALDAGVAFTDEQGCVSSANFAATTILGVPTSGIVGWSLVDQLRVAQRDDRAGRSDPLTSALASGRPQSGAILGIGRPGASVTWASVNVRPLFEGGSVEPSGAVVVLHDVTRERRLSEALDEARRRPALPAEPGTPAVVAAVPEELGDTTELLEAAIASSPVGAALFDRAGRLVIANPVADRLLAGSALLGRGPATRKVLRADTGEPVVVRDLPIRRACDGEPFDGLELYVVGDDDEGTYVRVSGRPVLGADGQPAGAVISVLDDTAAKRAEQELVATHEELERSNAELENFAYIASHDLSQPLQMVYGFAQLLREEGPRDVHADDHIDRIVRGCERMRDLIGDLLEYSRVMTEARPFEALDLAAAVDEVVSLFHHEVVEEGAAITVDALPTVQADRTQMSQLFQNLIGNALTYVAPGVTPRVHVSGMRQDHAVLVVVADNGIGIRPEDRERAFAMYQRLVAHETYPGTGIGLAVCAKIVDRHGGRIWIEDNPGGGSRFCFTLPDRPGPHQWDSAGSSGART